MMVAATTVGMKPPNAIVVQKEGEKGERRRRRVGGEGGKAMEEE
jgi:hypothetical protein